MSDSRSAAAPEIEAKLLVPRASHLDAIARVGQVGSYRLQARDTVHLHSIYIDTATLTLARHAVALRLRRTGRRWEATAKWAGLVDDIVHERPELTVPLPHAPRFPFVLPEGALHVHLSALVAGRPLAPILISDVRRQRFDVLAADQSDPVAELVLDRVQLRAPRQRKTAASYCEAEIELQNGTRRDVRTLAQLLQRRFDLAPSRESKFARGLALLHARDLAETRQLALRPRDTLGEATRKVVALHLGRMRKHDPGTRMGEDPEALHDMRVATRRLRAAVRAFEDGIGRLLQRYLDHELRWLGGVLGGVRDLDVQLGFLDEYRARAPAAHRDRLAHFREYIDAERTLRRREMLAALDSPRYFRLLVRLERFALSRAVPRPPFDEPVVRVGRRAIRRAFRRVRKRGERISETPTDEELHALRIRVKRLRYLLEFLRELTGKHGRQLVKRTVRLQDLLGAHHDGTVAASFIRHYVEGAGAQSPAPALLALGAFAAERRQRAEETRARFRRAWERFSRRRTTKELEAVLDRLRDYGRED